VAVLSYYKRRCDYEKVKTSHSHVGVFFTIRVASAEVETYGVDAVHSSAFFKVEHYGFGYVRGGFADISGKIVLDKADYAKSIVYVAIRTNSINTGNNQRDEHLKSKYFFDAKSYPIMVFKSNNIQKV